MKPLRRPRYHTRREWVPGAFARVTSRAFMTVPRAQGQVGSGGEEITESPVVLVRRMGSVPKIPVAPGGEGTG